MRGMVRGYTKPFKTVPEQLALLQARGLVVGEPTAVERELRRLGYYRFSGYAHFFRTPGDDSRFQPGLTFEQVLALATFDDELRMILLDGLQEVEVALRFHVGHRLGRRSAFAHRESGTLALEKTQWRVGADYATRSQHAEWLRSYDEQERRSQEAFTLHFRRQYQSRLPVWVATEVMTFGSLTQLLDLMGQNDRKLIAARFGIMDARGEGDPAHLSSWLDHLRHLRNLCAHHARVWNRTFDVIMTVPPGVPEVAHLNALSTRKLYGSLTGLRFLIARIDPLSTWYARALDLITGFARRSGVRLQQMGFPPAWQSEGIWAPRYRADLALLETVDAIDTLDAVSGPEARELVWRRGREKERKSWLRYLEAHDAVVSYRLGGSTFFPKFQFNDGAVRPLVADANEELFRRLRRVESDRGGASLLAYRWWTTPNLEHGFSEAPVARLMVDEAGVLAAARQWSRGVLVRATD